MNETREALEKLLNLDEKNLQLEFDFVECFDSGSDEADVLMEVKDGIGDMIVTIILLSKMVNMSSVDCLQAAYDVIKMRTGKMVDGQFVKDN